MTFMKPANVKLAAVTHLWKVAQLHLKTRLSEGVAIDFSSPPNVITAEVRELCMIYDVYHTQ